jgi:hypothetical protein
VVAEPDPRFTAGVRPAGFVEPWGKIKEGLPEILGDETIVRNSWESIDAWAYAFIWHMVVSF